MHVVLSIKKKLAKTNLKKEYSSELWRQCLLIVSLGMFKGKLSYYREILPPKGEGGRLRREKKGKCRCYQG